MQTISIYGGLKLFGQKTDKQFNSRKWDLSFKGKKKFMNIDTSFDCKIILISKDFQASRAALYCNLYRFGQGDINLISLDLRQTQMPAC